MPYAVKKQEGRYAVVNTTTGNICGRPRKSRSAALRVKNALEKTVNNFEASFQNSACNLETELDNMEAALLEHGPALVGVAMTNTPHLRLLDQEITVVEENGEKLLRIPVLRTGTFRHKNGKLRFTPKVFQKIVDNHAKGVTDFMPSLNLHHKRGAALAWFHPQRGGRLAVEGDLLVGYGKPTSEEAVDYVEKGLYAYASAEFVPDYRSNAVQLKMEALEEISSKEILTEMELQYTEEGEKIVFSKEQFGQVEQLIAELEEAQEKGVELKEQAATAETAVTTNTTKIANLEQQLNDAKAQIVELEGGDEGIEDIPESVRVQLEEQATEIKRLQEAGLRTKIDAILTNASRPVDGKTHPAFLLEFAKSVLHGQAVGEGESAIKLENSSSGGYARYLQQTIVHLLENLPRTERQDPETTTNDQKPGNTTDESQFALEGSYTEEDMEQAAQYLWELVE